LERRELAELAGISYSTLSKMESENYVPRVSVIRAIGRALEVPPDSFLSRDWASRC
jgi:transcriptional regulator with XRE-family HTH domain